MSNLRNLARNPLGGSSAPSMTEVDEAIFGKPGGSLDQLSDGKIVARATEIMKIWRDPKQPRRAIPATISMHNDGNPLEVVPMLQQWHAVAEEAAGVSINVEALLNGEGEGLDTDKFPSVVLEFVDLVRLAADIKALTLTNPITVVESDGKLLIETGERRYLAFHLLHLYFGEQWAKIPVKKSDGKDTVWRQATENTKRRALNSIGMARQIALLIMETRSNGEELYKSFEEMVPNGACDRRFYAQVSDGSVHRIPRGMGERIQAAMALGMEQLSQYRRLLRLTTDEVVNDALWTRADVENWPERVLRDISTLTVVKVSEVLNRSNWTLDDLKALKEVPTPTLTLPQNTGEGIIPRRPVTSEWMHKRVMTKANQVGTVVDVDGDLIKVLLPNGQKQLFQFTDLTLMADRPSPAPVAHPSTSVPGFAHDFHMGDKVRTRTGAEGEVVGLSGRLVTVRTKNGTSPHDHTLLTKIAKEAQFVIGDPVRTRSGRTGGVVEGYQGEQVRVNFPGGSPFVIPEYLLSLEDDEPQIDEDDIEEDVDPDAPPPTREWREGWTDGEGGNNQSDADKASSPNTTKPKRLFGLGSDEWLILDALHDLAVLSDDDGVAGLLTDLADITDIKITEMSHNQTLQTALDFADKTLQTALESLRTVQIASILQKIADAAVN